MAMMKNWDSGWREYSNPINPEGYILSIVDNEGRYLYANQGWQNINQTSTPLGKHYSDIHPNPNINEVIQSGVPQYGYYSDGAPESKGFFAAYIPIFENGNVKKIAIFSIPGANLQVPGQAARTTLTPHYTAKSIIGESSLCQALRSQIKKYAPAYAPVVIEGETGTGKELIAQALHSENGRGGPFVSLNCASIPETLFEAELFGYADGAFTGARRGGHAGLFERAHNGTLFLDEIHHLSLAFQAKLLRALQEKQVVRVGGAGPLTVSVRIVCATNQSLRQLVKDGLFREDLYFRLNVLSIHAPSLRERPEDIPLLVREFFQQLSTLYGVMPPRMDDSAIRLLKGYAWPGNVRELQNIIERVLVCCDNGKNVLTAEDFAGCLDSYEMTARTAPFEKPSAEISNLTTFAALRESFAAEERSMLVRALEEAGGNKTLAAQKLDISRTLLYNKLKEYGIDA